MNQQPLDPYLSLHKRANQKTTPSYFKRGIIATVHMQSATADIIVVGNQTTTIKNVPLSSGINAALIISGDKCLIHMFDENNPNDCIIVVCYGRNFQ